MHWITVFCVPLLLLLYFNFEQSGGLTDIIFNRKGFELKILMYTKSHICCIIFILDNPVLKCVFIIQKKIYIFTCCLPSGAVHHVPASYNMTMIYLEISNLSHCQNLSALPNNLLMYLKVAFDYWDTSWLVSALLQSALQWGHSQRLWLRGWDNRRAGWRWSLLAALLPWGSCSSLPLLILMTSVTLS